MVKMAHTTNSIFSHNGDERKLALQIRISNKIRVTKNAKPAKDAYWTLFSRDMLRAINPIAPNVYLIKLKMVGWKKHKIQIVKMVFFLPLSARLIQMYMKCGREWTKNKFISTTYKRLPNKWFYIFRLLYSNTMNQIQ